MKKIFSIIIALLLVAALSQPVGVLANLLAHETPLNPAGAAYEVNPDSLGILWITDADAGEIWQVDPGTGDTIVYPVGGSPSDAHSDGNGNVWWADSSNPLVGHLTTADKKVSQWYVPGSSGLYGTALDGNDGVWISDNSLSYLYHIDTNASEVCTYTLPLLAASDYLLASGSRVWLEDRVNGQVGVLETSNDTFTWWSLPFGGGPAGLALDEAGNLWWADPIQGAVGTLTDGETDFITQYMQTELHNPVMVSISNGLVWYSDQSRVGVLDPDHFSAEPVSVTSYDQVNPPFCTNATPSSPEDIEPASPDLIWNNVTYPILSNQTGWQVYQLPEGASSWGISAQESIWLVDQGRQLLIKFTRQTEVSIYIPLAIR